MVVADMVRLRGDYTLVGFLDDIHPERRGALFCGVPVLGGREQLPALREMGVESIIVGFGQCAARLEIARVVRTHGLKLATAVHPGAIVAQDAVIGAGTVIAAGAIVNPGCVVGENVILNTASSIDHECVIADGAHISPGAHLAGNVTVGRATWVGIGATVIERITIGADCVIGAGAVVVRDVPAGVLAFGAPARVIRRIKTDD